MKHIIHTDADGYVISLELTQDKIGSYQSTPFLI